MVNTVLDGPLQSLPFEVLVREKLEANASDFAAYREVPWLAKKYALTVLPSPASLKHLRAYAKGSPAPNPWIGFGAPCLDGRCVEGQGQFDITAVFSRLFPRGSIGNVDTVRQRELLSETAGKLRELARALNGDEANLYLQEAATEMRIESMDLEP